MAASHPFPYREPLVDPTTGLVTARWQIYFRDLDIAQDAAQRVVIAPVSLATQSASIGATPIPTAALAPGLYVVQTYMRITTPGAVSSSLTVTVSFTDGGIACSMSGAALTSNTTASVQGNVFPIRIDQATPITYATTYASNAVGQMVYSLVVALTQIALT